MGNSFGHQGLAFDVEIGSYQNRHRQYAPKMKRFLQKDSLVVGLKSDDDFQPVNGIEDYVVTSVRSAYQDGLNLYGYVLSNPLTKLDPTGRFVFEEWYEGGIPPHAGIKVTTGGGATWPVDFGPPGISPYYTVPPTSPPALYTRLRPRATGTLNFGNGSPKSCATATASQIASCLNVMMGKWNNTNYRTCFRNCFKFVKKAKSNCCL